MGVKFSNRYCLDDMFLSESDSVPLNSKGLMFESGIGLHDLGGVRILASTVDTVKQIYRGKLYTKLIDRLDKKLEENVEIFDGGPIGPWHLSKIGKKSGYKYKLQNNELGIIILIKNAYMKIEDVASHVKIEISPHCIRRDESFKEGIPTGLLQFEMDKLARWLMVAYEPAGVTIHMAVDVQGWQPEGNFLEKFVTRTRTSKSFSGIGSFDMKNLSEIATTYDDIQSLLFGKATSMQMAIYRKDKEILKSDKVDYFHNLWKEESAGWFDSEKPVWRIELRLHHGVMGDIGRGFDTEIESYQQAVPYLTNVWKYGLDRNRLMLTTSFIDPFWQMIIEDVEFKRPAKGVIVKRIKKKSFSCAGRNVAMMIGNMITLCARRQMKAIEVLKMLKGMALYADIEEYLAHKGLIEVHLLEMIDRGLQLRLLIGKAA